jgi:hypothetical protein
MERIAEERRPTWSKIVAEQSRDAADRVIARTIRAGVAEYDRARDLPTLIRLEPLNSERQGGHAEAGAIVSRLKSALRAERQKARSGHWSYDLNRHIALRQAYVAESERLSGLKGDG